MSPMRRLVFPLALVALLASTYVAAGLGAAGKHGSTVTFKVRLIQEVTYRHPHPPVGNDGDTFSTTLRLFAIGTVLGYPPNTPMGTMLFNWGPLENGSCSSAAAGCKGTTNLSTVTKLPGGTITAGGKSVSLTHGLVVPVVSGTGVFKGVKGSISIAPQGDAEDVFTLKLP
jgi:hypothetical protein